MHHVAVRHRSVTSVRDVIFTSLFLTFCGSNPLRFDDCVLMIFFFWTWRVQSVHAHLGPLTCTRSPPAWTVRSGWLGWWLCKASLRPTSFPIFFWRCFRFLHNQDHRPKSNLGASTAHLFMALRCGPSDMFDHSSGPMFSRHAVTCFFGGLPWTHTFPSVRFLLTSANRVTPIQVQTVAFRHPCTNYHRWSPNEVHPCSFSFLWTSM